MTDIKAVMSWLEGLTQDDWPEWHSDSEVRETAKAALELLKEQNENIGHWVVLENCSNAGVYCSECHTKIFDRYPMKKKYSYFCPHCGTRMEGQAVKLDELEK